MPSLLSRYDHYVPRQSIILPVILLATSILACIGTPVPHSLRTSAIAWAVVWAYAALRLRGKGNGSAQGGRTAAWAAGGLLAIAQICGRSVDGRGIWWANVRILYTVYLEYHLANMVDLAEITLCHYRACSHLRSTSSIVQSISQRSPTLRPRARRKHRVLRTLRRPAPGHLWQS